MYKLYELKNKDKLNVINDIYNFDNPDYVYYLFNNNTFNNSYIYKNTLIDNNYLSISGNIKSIIKINNKEFIKIENDFKENTLNKISINKPNNIKELKELLNKYNYLNILNKINELSNINNLVLSCIDDNYYCYNESIRLSHNFREIIDIYDYLITILNIKNNIIAINNVNYNSIKNINSINGIIDNNSIKLIPNKYLINNKIFLCDYLNIDINNTLILTTNELYDLYLLIFKKNLNIKKLITISGNNIKDTKVIYTKLGVSLKELLDNYIDIINDDYNIFVNGLYKGYIVNDLVIDNNIDYIVINKKENKDILPCISCGACMKICPFNINIKYYLDNKKVSNKCIKCGLCNYICPCNIKIKELISNEKYF